MPRALWMVLALVAFVAAFAHPVAADPSPTGRTPKLSWTPERQALWNRMRAENHPWWRQIQANADLSGTASARYADLGQWATVAYQVTGDPIYAQKAWKEANSRLKGTALPNTSRNFTREHFIEYAWMYDWLYPALTDAQRQQWIDSLNYWADLCLSQTDVSWGTRLSDSDETTGHYFGIVFWDLASAADNPRAGTFISHSKVGGLDQTGTSRNNMRNAVSDYIRRAEGGQWIESTKYNMGTLQLLLMGADGATTATGADHFPELVPFRKDVALAQMHEVTPDLKKAFQWGDNEEPRSLNRDRRVSLVTILAGLLKDDATVGPAIKNFRDAIEGGEEPHFRWMILGNPYAASADFRNALSLGHTAPGMGIVFFRDGASSSRSLFASHLSSRSTVDHETHYFANFDLYRAGEFAVTHIIGYDANEGEHHNSMLLAGLSVMDEARGTVAAEFGADGSYAYHVGATGGNRYKNGYYNPPPRFVHEWTRSLLYLPSTDQQHDTVVVFDRVNTEDPETLTKLDRYSSNDQSRITGSPALKQWIIHAPVAPTVTTEAIAWQTPGGQAVRVTTLLPAVQNRSVYDESTLGLKGTIQSSERKFQVRIKPAVDQRWDTFLNVVQAANTTGGLGNTLVASTNGAAQGALIKRSGHPNVLALFNATQGPNLAATATDGGYLKANTALLSTLNANRLHTTGFTLTFASDTSSTIAYLMDLDPAKQWLVAVDGLQETALAVSGQGLARVAVSGSGSHTLQVRPAGAVIDTTNPTITNIQVSNLFDTSALVTWMTDEAATEQVQYGLTGSYGSLVPLTSTLSTSHEVLLSGLLPETAYSYRVSSTDAAGNTAVSTGATFQTLAAGTPPPPPSPEGALMTEVSASSGKTYVVDTLANGALKFIDRTMLFSSVPSAYASAALIRTANDDKWLTSPAHLVFILTENATVYVLYDIRATVLPGWLDGTWTATSDAFDGRRAYYKAFPAGQVVLGGNAAAPMAGAESHYSVAAIRGGTPAPTPPANTAPTLTAIGPQTIAEDQELIIGVAGSDADGDALTFSASGLPSGATFEGQTFTWTPTFDQAGTYAMTVTVSDGNLTDTETISMTVTDVPQNAAPVVQAGPDLSATLNSPVTVTLQGVVSDDGLPSDSLSGSWSVVSGPGTVAFGDATQAHTTATFETAGTYVLRLTASDGALSASDDMTAVVNPPVASPLMTNPILGSGRRAEIDRAGIGIRVYTDRTYTVTAVPAALTGYEFLRLPNEDKYRKDSAYVTVTLARAATLYVAFDPRADAIPSWLKYSWTPAGETLQTSDGPRALYRKAFPAGTVKLGGNGALWKIDAYSQYSVIAVPN